MYIFERDNDTICSNFSTFIFSPFLMSKVVNIGIFNTLSKFESKKSSYNH